MPNRRRRRLAGERARSLTLVAAALCACAPEGSHRTAASVSAEVRGDERAHALVLYDDAGPYGWLGELYGAGVGVIASHFGDWTAMPVSAYRRGAMSSRSAVIYVGSSFDQPLPDAFVDDVLAETTSVVWIGQNVWTLARRAPDFSSRFGFVPDAFDPSPVHAVTYKGTRLARRADGGDGIMTYREISPTATVLAWAQRDDGTELPWALRTRRFTYVGEQPLAYVTDGDRLLALCDLLFDVLAPHAPRAPYVTERHRALVRIEDVSARSSPAALREIADRLARRGVPFSVAVIPVFEDPLGARSDGRPQRTPLKDAPEVCEALRYMLARGGSLVLHGYTHQHGSAPNPYSGASGEDFEFFRAHIDADDCVTLDGPVAEDSEAWAANRIARALAELASAGLPRPHIFEYPHYAGSPADSRAIARTLDVAFQRELLFPGALGGAADAHAPLGLALPFAVRDVYGWRVLPENLGAYIPTPYNQQPIETPHDLVARARALRVVRDGVAGFFFHPTFDPSILESIVDGIRAEGYSFVTAESLADELP